MDTREIVDWLQSTYMRLCSDPVQIEIEPYLDDYYIFRITCSKRDYDYLFGDGSKARSGIGSVVRQMGKKNDFMTRVIYKVA